MVVMDAVYSGPISAGSLPAAWSIQMELIVVLVMMLVCSVNPFMVKRKMFHQRKNKYCRARVNKILGGVTKARLKWGHSSHLSRVSGILWNGPEFPTAGGDGCVNANISFLLPSAEGRVAASTLCCSVFLLGACRWWWIIVTGTNCDIVLGVLSL